MDLIARLIRIFQGQPLRPRPVDTNFQRIQSQLDALTNTVNSLTAAAGDTEVVQARGQGFNDLAETLATVFPKIGTGVLTRYLQLADTDAVTNWTNNRTDSDPVTLNSDNVIEGAHSIEILKDSGDLSPLTYSYALGSLDLENRYFKFSLYLDEGAAALSDSYVHLMVDESNYKTFNLPAFSVGWNTVEFDANSPNSTTGTVEDDDAINTLRFSFSTSAGNTFASGDICIDRIEYYGEELRVVPGAAYPDIAIRAGAINTPYGYMKKAETTTTCFAKPTANSRFDLVTADGNGNIHITKGVESATPEIPNTPDGHFVIAHIIRRATEDGTTPFLKQTDDDLTNAVIHDRRTFLTNATEFGTIQVAGGNIPKTIAYVSPTGEAPFTSIQSAVNYVNALGGGMVVVGAGTYDENIVLTGMSNITIQGVGVSSVIQPTSGKGVVSLNTGGNESKYLCIRDLKISCTAAKALEFDYVDNSKVENVVMLSTSGYSMTLDYCDYFVLLNNEYGGSYAAKSTITNSYKYTEDGYCKDQVVWCRDLSSAEDTYAQRGFSYYSAMYGKFLKAIDSSLLEVGETGGVASHDLSHNHGITTFDHTKTTEQILEGTTGGKYVLAGITPSDYSHNHTIMSDLSTIDNKPPYLELIPMIHR